MYKCKECGHLFEDGEQVSWTESHGERLVGCPICKGVYESARPCNLCGSYEEKESAEEYCEKCKKDVKKRFNDFVEKEFTKEERDLLNELYDGERI